MAYPGGKHFFAAITAPLHRKKGAYFILPLLKPATRKDIVLLFSPHPDDETFFAGGYLAAALQAKASVHVVLISDGNKHGHTEERIAEFQRAMRLLGVERHNLEFYLLPDGTLIKQSSIFRSKVVESLTRIMPTIVLGPHCSDAHSDHKLVAEVLREEVSCTLLAYLTHFPPRFPFPRKHDPKLPLLPPKKLESQSWYSFPLDSHIQDLRRVACAAYKRELNTPTLRSLLLAFDRTNELFVVRKPE
jgi:LmbE family N-acetylglucosaminyl deacetylase